MITEDKHKKRRATDKMGPFATLIGADTVFIGKIRNKNGCVIYGKVEGDCEVEGMLVLGEGGFWQGHIRAASVQISGEVEGNIEAVASLELTSTAHVVGSITAGAIAIAEGAVHHGEISILGQKAAVHFKEKRTDDSE